MSSSLRLCLDLNVWYADLLASKRGREDTACTSLVEIVREGTCVLGSVQLIVSWGMLNRLQQVLVSKLKVSHKEANDYIEIIASYAQVGGVGSPQLTLGGTGVVSLKDTEDAHVLETAIAGKASVLVTANLDDFKSQDALKKEDNYALAKKNEYFVYPACNPSLYIVHPFLMMNWIRQGSIPKF